MRRQIIQSVGYNFMGFCPAAVHIDTEGNPTFLVNRDVFPTAPEFAQRFYLAHEVGHWIMNTSNEEVADAFALGILAGTERRSLKKSLEALNRMHTIPYQRLDALYRRCLATDKASKTLT